MSRMAQFAQRMTIAFYLCTAITLPAQEVSFESTLDWRTGTITTHAGIDITDMEVPLPAARRTATLNAERRIAGHIVGFVKSIAVSGSETVGDRVMADASLLTGIYEYAENFATVRSYVDSRLETLRIDFVHTLFPDFASLFITHARVAGKPPYLGFSPSTEFTGLVIYAVDPLPVYGKTGESSLLQPALEPRIFDESMRLIYDTGMVDPETARGSGLVQYVSDIDLLAHKDRVGIFPLVTVARGVFGENATDLIIPDDVAERILSLDANGDILRYARIMVICPQSRLTRSSEIE